MTHGKYKEPLLGDLALFHKRLQKSVVCQGISPAFRRLRWSGTDLPKKMSSVVCTKWRNKAKNRGDYCKKCDCGLCVVPCFELWQTKAQLSLELTVLYLIECWVCNMIYSNEAELHAPARVERILREVLGLQSTQWYMNQNYGWCGIRGGTARVA
jgi:hypothetical protein